MADPISWFAKVVADFVGAAFINSAAYPLIYATAYYGTYAATAAVVTAGLGAIARGQLPDPEGAKITRKQPRPPRQYVIGGPSRFSGAYMLRETNANNLAVVLALAEGRLDEISRVYLNDDVAVIDGDGWVLEGEDIRYGFHRVKLDWRLGLPTETHYSQLTEKFSSVWPTTARGDGIASLMMLCNHGSMEYFNRDFPNGEPIPSVVGQGVCYDWRDEAQDREDESTWGPSANPVVWLVHLEWYLYGRSWARCIEPVLDALTVEADYCDELVEKMGGTEPRYRFGGNFFSNTEPAAVRAGILAAMDGWLSTNGKGQLIIKAGRYEEPTFTIPAEHIEGYTWRAFQTDEEACNELVVSYVSPEHHYTEVEADPWRDEAGITATGRVRSENLQLTWVNYPTQARRLAKRKMSRLAAERRGTIRTGIYGLNGLGERYIRVQNPELSSMADVVVEVMNVEVDFASGQVAFDVILADENIDEWNPAAEEGLNPGTVGRPGVVPLAPPTIDTVEVFFDDYGSPRLRITATGPDRDDILWRIGYRVAGDVAFVEDTATDLDPSTPVLLESGLVPQGDLEVIVGYQTGGGTLSWMDAGNAYSINTASVPSAPTEMAAEVVGANVEVSWRNPASLTLSYVAVFRGSTSVLVDATDISGPLSPTGLGAPQTFSETTPAAGTWYYWVIAYNEDDVASTAAGPAELAVYEAETYAILAEFTTPADDAEAEAVNDRVLAIKAAGLWSKLDGWWQWRFAKDADASLVNWIDPSGPKITVMGAPVFSANGWTGDLVDDYLDSGLVLNALAKLSQDSASIGVWVSASGTTDTHALWGKNTDGFRGSLTASGNINARINDAANITMTGSAVVQPGLYALNRSGASAREAYKDGVLVTSDTQASAAVAAENLWFMRLQMAYGALPLGGAYVGASLDATEHAAAFAIMTAP